MAATSLCPSSASKRIVSAFSLACARHGLAPDSAHPRAAYLVWRAAGGRLGNALAGIDRVTREAARGVSSLGLETVAVRMMGGAR